MAATDWFSIDIRGKSGHAGKPHLCTDASVIAAATVMNLQTIVSRNTDPLDSAVAVSYTHLDVYKRQMQHWPIWDI